MKKEDPPSGSSEAECVGATLRTEILKLPARSRMVFTLYTWEGLTPREIVTRMAAAGVKLNVSEVRQHLVSAALCLKEAVERGESVALELPKTTPAPQSDSVDEGRFRPIGTPHELA